MAAKVSTMPPMMGVLLPIRSERNPEGSSKKILEMKKLATTTPMKTPVAPRLWAKRGRKGLIIPPPNMVRIPWRRRM